MARKSTASRNEWRRSLEAAFAKDLADCGYNMAEGAIYTNRRTPVKVECPYGHTFPIVPSNFYNNWYGEILSHQQIDIDPERMCPRCRQINDREATMTRLNTYARQRGWQVNVLDEPTFKKGTECQTCGLRRDHEMALHRMMGMWTRCSGCAEKGYENDDMWWVRDHDHIVGEDLRVSAFLWVGRQPEFLCDLDEKEQIPLLEDDGRLTGYTQSTARTKLGAALADALLDKAKEYNILNTEEFNPHFAGWNAFGEPKYKFPVNMKSPLTRAVQGL
jgi:hypothetical protein